MSKIYVPDYESTNCVTWYDSNTLRVFEFMPTVNNTVSYKDYFINSHYLGYSGSISFTSNESLPTCLLSSDITTDFYYRTDLADILIIFIIIVVFCFYFPYKLISRMFGRWLKV